jgi:hypothetical protein
MIVTVVTFHLPRQASIAEMTELFRSTAPKYLNCPGLLRKNYWVSEDGRRAGGIYFWSTRGDAERLYTSECKQTLEAKYKSVPEIAYLQSPVMVDNANGRISVTA